MLVILVCLLQGTKLQNALATSHVGTDTHIDGNRRSRSAQSRLLNESVPLAAGGGPMDPAQSHAVGNSIPASHGNSTSADGQPSHWLVENQSSHKPPSKAPMKGSDRTSHNLDILGAVLIVFGLFSAVLWLMNRGMPHMMDDMYRLRNQRQFHSIVPESTQSAVEVDLGLNPSTFNIGCVISETMPGSPHGVDRDPSGEAAEFPEGAPSTLSSRQVTLP